MRFRSTIPVLCGTLLVWAAAPNAGAAPASDWSKSTTVKSSKSNTSDRVRGGPKARAKGTIVKSKSNISNN